MLKYLGILEVQISSDVSTAENVLMTQTKHSSEHKSVNLLINLIKVKFIKISNF